MMPGIHYITPFVVTLLGMPKHSSASIPFDFEVPRSYVVDIVAFKANSDDHVDYGYSKSGPVLDLGVESLQKIFSHSLLNFTSRSINVPNSDCGASATHAAFKVTRFYYWEGGKTSVFGLFGPACSGGLIPASLLAKGWNVSVFTNYGTDYILADKKKYRTLTRLSPFLPESTFPFVRSLMRQFNWTDVSIVCDKGLATGFASAGAYPDCTNLFNVFTNMNEFNVKRFSDDFGTIPVNGSGFDFNPILTAIKETSRGTCSGGGPTPSLV